MSLTLFPAAVRAGATALAVYQGTPGRRVDWSLTGAGTLVALADMTDATGRAAAVFTPVTAGDSITIGVSAGA